MTDETPASLDSRDADRFFAQLREVLPSFAPVDDAGRSDWDDDQEGRLDYIRVAALAGHLAHLAAAGEWPDVRAALEVAEETVGSADVYTRTLMVEGLLEDIQNAALRSEGRVRLVDVRTLLGPLSAQAWDELMQMWHGSGASARAHLPEGALPDKG